MSLINCRIKRNGVHIRIAPFCISGLIAGCAGPERTEVHREWFEYAALLKGISLRMGDSLASASEATNRNYLWERSLSSLEDTSEPWDLDTAGMRIPVPSLEGFKSYGFQIRSHRTPTTGDTIHSASGGDTDTNRLDVNITRLEWVGNAPFMVDVQPDSLASTLEGIPFDPGFAPALPRHSRIMARKAARFRVEFDGWVLQGDVHIVEYRYASTTYDIEHEGL